MSLQHRVNDDVIRDAENIRIPIHILAYHGAMDDYFKKREALDEWKRIEVSLSSSPMSNLCSMETRVMPEVGYARTQNQALQIIQWIQQHMALIEPTIHSSRHRSFSNDTT